MAQIATLAPAAQRWQRMLAPAITIGGLGAATVALHFRDPHASGSWGLCPSAMLGISCPGCGGLRAVNDLTNLQLVDAASSNLLFVLALPLILFALVRWVTDQWRGAARTPPAWAAGPVTTGVVAVLIVFTVLRNLPQFHWLAP
jgi:Protein of unknown function (DUF2752)